MSGNALNALEARLRHQLKLTPLLAKLSAWAAERDEMKWPAKNHRDPVADDGAFVVIELKVSRAYDRVVGQLLRYMAWVKSNLADGAPVRGIIVASELSDDLKLAASLVSGVKLVEYEISFALRPINT